MGGKGGLSQVSKNSSCLKEERFLYQEALSVSLINPVRVSSIIINKEKACLVGHSVGQLRSPG